MDVAVNPGPCQRPLSPSNNYGSFFNLTDTHSSGVANAIGTSSSTEVSPRPYTRDELLHLRYSSVRQVAVYLLQQLKANVF